MQRQHWLPGYWNRQHWKPGLIGRGPRFSIFLGAIFSRHFFAPHHLSLNLNLNLCGLAKFIRRLTCNCLKRVCNGECEEQCREFIRRLTCNCLKRVCNGECEEQCREFIRRLTCNCLKRVCIGECEEQCHGSYSFLCSIANVLSGRNAT